MAKDKRIPLEKEEESILDAVDLNSAEPEKDVPMSIKSIKTVSKEGQVGDRPPMSDPKWHDYVMRQFEESELDPQGSPFVHALRRVARQLLGPITKSRGKIVQAPTYQSSNSVVLTPATAEYEVEILWCDPHDTKGCGAYPVVYQDAADVYFGNTDMDFARHASAMAVTRAEARTLRKALGLGKVISAEERTQVPLEEAGLDGNIIPDQIRILNTLCKRLNINAMKFINSGKSQYKSVTEMTFQKASEIIDFLSGVQTDPTKIKPEWRGYVPKWSGVEL